MKGRIVEEGTHRITLGDAIGIRKGIDEGSTDCITLGDAVDIRDLYEIIGSGQGQL